MPLPSFLQRFRVGQAKDQVVSAATPSEEARTRARRRLIGAALLVVAGVIGFPLLFDSQPRPLPSDLPIVMPRKDGGRSVDLPRVTAAATVDHADEPAAAAHPLPPDEPAAAEPAPAALPRIASAAASSEPGAPTVAAAVQSPAQPEPSAKLAAKPAVKPVTKPVPKPVAKPVAKASTKPLDQPASSEVADAARARALLNGQAVDQPAAGAAHAAAAEARYIVQIGAFADAPKAHDARLKVEKLGLKTYTQVVNGDGGKRIRVRVGPFADRAAAEKAAGKIRQAGLTAAILTL